MNGPRDGRIRLRAAGVRLEIRDAGDAGVRFRSVCARCGETLADRTLSHVAATGVSVDQVATINALLGGRDLRGGGGGRD